MTIDAAALGVARFGLAPSLAADLAATGVDFARLTAEGLLNILCERRQRAMRPKRRTVSRSPIPSPPRASPPGVAPAARVVTF